MANFRVVAPAGGTISLQFSIVFSALEKGAGKSPPIETIEVFQTLPAPFRPNPAQGEFRTRMEKKDGACISTSMAGRKATDAAA